MKIVATPHFKKSFSLLPKETKTKFRKQVNFLLENLRHPSLRAKKYDEKKKIWQARVDLNYRFYFLIQVDLYILLDVREHPK